MVDEGKEDEEAGEGRQEGGKEIAGRRRMWVEWRKVEERRRSPLSHRRGKGKEEYGKGGFGGKTGERSGERARAFGKMLHGEGG